MENKKIWFKRKRYGWGWYPATWEGWAITAVWLGFFVVGEILYLNHMSTTPTLLASIVFWIYVLVIVSILIYVCYRYGEKPRWQWGDKDKE